MRQSTQSRTLLEVAVVQICYLQDLQSLSDLIHALQAGKAPPLPIGSSTSSPSALAAPSIPSSSSSSLSEPVEEKKKVEVALDRGDRTERSLPRETPTSYERPIELKLADGAVLAEGNESTSTRNALDSFGSLPAVPQLSTDLQREAEAKEAHSFNPMEQWMRATQSIGGYVTDCASMAVRVEISAVGTWTILFPRGCDFACDVCSEAANRSAIEEALRRIAGRAIPLQLQTSNLAPREAALAPSRPATVSQPQLIRQYSEHPLVQSLMKAIDGEVVRVDLAPVPATPASHLSGTTAPVRSSPSESANS